MSLYCSGAGGILLGDGGDGQPLNITVSYPFTLAFWFYPTNLSGAQDIFHVAATAADNSYWVGLNSTSLQVQTWNGVAATTLNQSGIVVNRWNHGVGRFVSNTSRAIHLNGSPQTLGTTNSNQTSQVLDKFILGQANFSGRFFNGYIAHAALWDANLQNADVALLGRGVSPLAVRRQNLAVYFALQSPMLLNLADSKSRLNKAASTRGFKFSNWEPPVKTVLPKNPRRVIETTAAPSIVIPNLYRQRQMQGMAA